MAAFDEIAKRSPINRVAFDVSSQGTHFSFQPRQLNVVRSDIPLPVTTRCIPGEEDFTGRILGRLTVIGRSDEPIKNEWFPHIKWVVRCSCGWYERRRSKVLREMKPQDQMCSSCKLLEQRKAGFGPWLRTEEKLSPPIIQSPVRAIEVEVQQKSYKKRRRLPKTPIPQNLRWIIWERDNFTCQECGTRKLLSIDHIVPESQGGLMIFENLQTLCIRCNSSKGAR